MIYIIDPSLSPTLPCLVSLLPYLEVRTCLLASAVRSAFFQAILVSFLLEVGGEATIWQYPNSLYRYLVPSRTLEKIDHGCYADGRPNHHDVEGAAGNGVVAGVCGSLTLAIWNEIVLEELTWLMNESNSKISLCRVSSAPSAGSTSPASAPAVRS